MAFGGAVKLTGESEYKRALNNIKLGLKEVTAQMKLTSVSYDKNDKSVAALTARTKDLAAKMDLQKSKVEQIKKQYTTLSQQYDKQTQKHNALIKSYENEKAKLETVAKELGTTSKEYQAQKKVVEQYESDIKKSTKAQDANKETLSKMRVELKNAEADYKTSEKALNGLNVELDDSKRKAAETKTAYSKLKDEISEQQSKLDELKKKYANVVLEQGKNSTEAQELKREYEKLTSELKDNTDKLKDAEQGFDDLGDAAQDSADKASNAANGGFTVFKGALSNMVSGVVSDAISKLKDLAREAYNAGTNFESAMSQVEAISGATGEELTQLTDKAKEMGAKTKFSATQSAEAFNYMAMAGWKTEDMLGGIEGIMNLAAASGEDLATTSDIVTDALTAMGYSAEDSARLADVMAAASSNANTNVGLMGSTFQYVAPVVGALGYNMEDTAVSIGLMANAGIKGEKAGTALRSILTRLSTDAGASSKSLGALGTLTEELGVQFYNTNGTTRELSAVINDSRKAWSGLSEEQQVSYAKTIAGQEAMSGWLALMNAAPADVMKLTDAVQGSNGAAQAMADTMQDNVAGSMTILKSQIEGVQIQIFEKLAPAFKEALKKAQEFIKNVNWDKFGNKVKNALNKALEGLKWIIKNRHNIVNALKAVVAAFAIAKIAKWTKAMSDATKGIIDFVKKSALAAAAKKADTQAETANTAAKVANTAASTAGTNASTASTAAATTNTAAKVANTSATTAGTVATNAATVATHALNAAWKSNPIGLVVAGITTLISVLGMFINKSDEASKEDEEFKAQVEETTKKLEERQQAVDDNVQAYKDMQQATQDNINIGMTEANHYKDLWSELQNIVDENGKVQKGYEARADFITSTLSDALGIEFEKTGNVIQNYKDIQKEIDNVMEKKKAQIILDSQEDLYSEALKNQQQALRDLDTYEADYVKARGERDALKKQYTDEFAAAEKAYAEWAADNFSARKGQLYDEAKAAAQSTYDKLTAKQTEVNGLEKSYKDQLDLYSQYAYNIGLYEDNLAKFHDGKYKEMSQVTWDYVKEFKGAGDAEKALLEDQIKATESHLGRLETMRDESNSDIYDSQIKDARKKLTQLKKDLGTYTKTTGKELDKTELEWSNSLAAQLSDITGKSIKFKNAGDGNVQAYIDGVKTGKPVSKKEAAKLVDGAIKEITDKTPEAKKAGEDLIDGVNKGVKNQDKQSGVFAAISNFGSKLLGRLRTALKEKSPSKATKEMGEYLMEGLSIGVEKEGKNALKTVEKTGTNILGALNAELKAGAKIGKIDVSAATIKPDLTAAAQQINYEIKKRDNGFNNMVEAFKTALSQMKIELDDEVAGEFVEKTVTKVIYA